MSLSSPAPICRPSWISSFRHTSRTTRRPATRRTRDAAPWSCWEAAEGAPAVPIELYRIDDRLIHGQVVVGWGQPMDVGFIVLVDDEVAASDWEQELYRLGVPPGMDVYFETVAGAAEAFPRFVGDARVGILLTKDIETMDRLASTIAALRTINLGGLHYR